VDRNLTSHFVLFQIVRILFELCQTPKRYIFYFTL
jgi:hypothetical protein